MAFDSTPVKLFIKGGSNTIGIYARSSIAYDSRGGPFRIPPELSLPESSNASGVMSTLPLPPIGIPDLVSGKDFWIPPINCDGVSNNKKAAKLIISELSAYPNLLIGVNICTSRNQYRSYLLIVDIPKLVLKPLAVSSFLGSRYILSTDT